MTNQDLRKQRINRIYMNIKACSDRDVGCNEKKLTAMISIEMGFRPEKVKEYLNDLILTGRVERDFGDLWVVGKAKEVELTKQEKQVLGI